jgi:hypothetical protein
MENSDYVFASFDSEDMGICFVVTPLEYFKENECLDDDCYLDLEEYGLVESAECVYEMIDQDIDPETIRQALLDDGFVEDDEFTEYVNGFNN